MEIVGAFKSSIKKRIREWDFYYVSFYLLRNLNIGIDKFAFNAESIGDKLEIYIYTYIFKLIENGKSVSH